MSDRFAQIASALRTADRLDREWQGKVPGAGDATHTPWMPFPRYDFVAMLTDALAETEGDRFLEIGCGIGTRMILAQEIFGLDVTGVERVPEYVAQAQELGLNAMEADAASWKGYGDYDILWFNRPFRDREMQAGLESQVWAETRPGTVVMCANLENPPSGLWYPILDDWEIRRGIWQKLPAAH